MDDYTLALHWLPAARSGFAVPLQWKNWADMRIDNSDVPPTWLLDMSVSNDVVMLTKALAPPSSDVQGGDICGQSDDISLGYLWLRHERGDLSLEDTLKRAGEIADNYDTSIECESFYSILTTLRQAGTRAEDRVAVERKAKTLFEPYRALAESQWLALMGAGNATDHS